MVTAYTFQNILKRLFLSTDDYETETAPQKPYTNGLSGKSHKQQQRLRERVVGGKGKR